MNGNGMKRMFSHGARVSVLGALLLCSFARVFFAASPAVALPLAPSFAARSLDGKVVASTQLAGKAYIVNFFASWCPPCCAEVPDMVSLQKKYERNGFTFIGVAVNENVPAIRAFITKNHITYPVVMADDKIVSAFSRYVSGGLNAIPTSFVVNPAGRISLVITGARSKDDFEKIIVDTLKKPEPLNKVLIP